MNISSITPTSPLTATSPVTGTQTSQSTATTSGAAGSTDRTQLTKLGELMSKLQDLESTDPAKAKQVLTSIASSLTAQANSAGNTDPHLQELADKFTTAANTGDLSGLKPHGGHHHHQAEAQATPAPGDAQAASSKTASYAQSGSDPRSQLASIISNALSSAGA